MDERDIAEIVAQTTAKAAGHLIKFRQGDIPVCHTRIEKQGIPFTKRKLLALHPLEDGSLEVTAVDPKVLFDEAQREQED